MTRGKHNTALMKRESSPVPLEFTGKDFFGRFFDDFFKIQPFPGMGFPEVRFPEFDRIGVRTDFSSRAVMNEEKDRFVVKAEMPGFKKEDVKVKMHNRMLTISAERKEEKKEKQYHEKSYGRFESSFTLPENVVVSKIKTHYSNGEMTVELPKDHKMLKAA